MSELRDDEETRQDWEGSGLTSSRGRYIPNLVYSFTATATKITTDVMGVSISCLADSLVDTSLVLLHRARLGPRAWMIKTLKFVLGVLISWIYNRDLLTF